MFLQKLTASSCFLKSIEMEIHSKSEIMRFEFVSYVSNKTQGGKKTCTVQGKMNQNISKLNGTLTLTQHHLIPRNWKKPSLLSKPFVKPQGDQQFAGPIFYTILVHKHGCGKTLIQAFHIKNGNCRFSWLITIIVFDDIFGIL